MELASAWVRFLGREDPLEKEMATHSRILAWRIHWTEEPGRLQSMGSRVGLDLATKQPPPPVISRFQSHPFLLQMSKSRRPARRRDTRGDGVGPGLELSYLPSTCCQMPPNVCILAWTEAGESVAYAPHRSSTGKARPGYYRHFSGGDSEGTLQGGELPTVGSSGSRGTT